MYKSVLIPAILLLLLSINGVAQQPATPPPYVSGTSINYVRTWTATAPTTDANTLIQGSLLKVKEATQYFDGLGRPLQTVIKKGSLVTTTVTSVDADTANAKDLVTPVLYDEFGRESYRFLPFASGGNDGAFKTDPYVQHQSFLNAQYGNQGNDKNYGYSQTLFEASPLSRVLEQFAPGQSWAGSATQPNESDRHSIKTRYWANTTTDAVRVWEVANGVLGSTIGSSYTTSQTYPAGVLYKSVTVDEQGKQVIEFKDKAGQMVLKKVQLTAGNDGGGGSGHAGWLCTYYIYDDLNNLRCVIQPEGVKAMNDAASWTLTTTLLAEQCFRYEYDERRRMVVKKVPGAAEVVMVYDVRNRLVLTQDGNLRAQGSWNYTLYDNLDRPVKTGLVNPASNDPVTHWNTAMSKTGDSNAGIQCPDAGMLINATVLTETFYDTYDWLAVETTSGLDGNYNNGADSYFESASDTQFPYARTTQKDGRTRGLVTGTKVNILGTPNYTYTLTLYDDKARAIQVKTKNHTTGSDLVTTQYSWSGQPLTVVTREQNGATGLAVTTVTKYNYDALGRMVKTIKNVSSSDGLSSGDRILSVNRYDALGQLVNKTLGAMDANGTAGAEIQSYAYNIRGWLLGMNRGYANGSNNSGSFGFELNYDQYPVFGGAIGNRFYNGNIAGMSWRGKTGSAEIRRYDFSYDNANRIMNADFKQHNGSSFAATGTFNSRMGDGNPSNPESAYDYNGNIKAMTQQGLYNSNSITIDQLTYTYQAGSNKLAKVTDQAGDTRSYQLGDFNDGANGSDDYTYDVNGNLTKDENKNISAISYNILNLPQQIDVTGKGTISYQYDAAGNKLSKTVNETGQGQKETTYLGGMIFENNALQHVAMEEGRFRSNGSAFTADYFLKDHLGNVRSMVNENGTLLEETHYYPFGLIQHGISYQNISVVTNRYKYNGIEKNEDLGLNQYDAFYRNLDPQIGRFWQPDPKVVQFESQYVSMSNNPILNTDFLGDTTIYYGMNGEEIGVINNAGAVTRMMVDEAAYNSYMTTNYSEADFDDQSIANSFVSGVTKHLDNLEASTKTDMIAREQSLSLEFVGEAKDVTSDGKTRQMGAGYMNVYSKFDNGRSAQIASYEALSGPMYNGLLPNGLYTALKPQIGNQFSDEKGFGFKMVLNPNRSIGMSGRGDFRIHPVQRINYGTRVVKTSTEGCVGLSGGHNQVVGFYNTVSAYFQNHKSINLSVNIKNNANVKSQLGSKTHY